MAKKAAQSRISRWFSSPRTEVISPDSCSCGDRRSRLQLCTRNVNFQRINTRAEMIIDRLGIIDAVLGDGLGPVIARLEVIAEFA